MELQERKQDKQKLETQACEDGGKELLEKWRLFFLAGFTMHIQVMFK